MIVHHLLLLITSNSQFQVLTPSRTVWAVSTKNSPQEICLVWYYQLLDSMHPKQVPKLRFFYCL